MSILTKEERAVLREFMSQYDYDGGDIVSTNEMERALDTIDALERTIKGIERAETMQQVETVLIAARAFGIIEEAE